MNERRDEMEIAGRTAVLFWVAAISVSGLIICAGWLLIRALQHLTIIP